MTVQAFWFNDPSTYHVSKALNKNTNLVLGGYERDAFLKIKRKYKNTNSKNQVRKKKI